MGIVGNKSQLYVKETVATTWVARKACEAAYVFGIRPKVYSRGNTLYIEELPLDLWRAAITGFKQLGEVPHGTFSF